MSSSSQRLLPYQKLTVWARASSLAELCSSSPLQDSELRGQATRAAKSVGLNIAEGAALSGKTRLRFFRIARASAVEVAAAYDLGAAMGEKCRSDEVVELVNEIYAMLTTLIQRLE